MIWAGFYRGALGSEIITQGFFGGVVYSVHTRIF